jgi:hypothetical protein
VRLVDGVRPAAQTSCKPLTSSLQIAQTSIIPGRDSRLLPAVRRLLFIVVPVCLLAVPTASASTPGSVSLEFRNGAGVAKVRFRGNFLGHVDQGRVIATSNVILSGCEFRKRLADGRILCRGTALGFRTLSSTRWRLTLSGRGISAGGFVRGCMTLDGVDMGVTGTFRKGTNPAWRPWPRTATGYRLGLGC